MNASGNLFNGVQVANTSGLNYDINRPSSFSKTQNLNLNATQARLNFDGKFDDNWSTSIKIRAYRDNLASNGNSMEQSFGANKNAGQLGAANGRTLVDLPALYADYNQGPLWIRMGNQQIAWGEAVFFRISDLANGLDLRRHSVLDVASEEFSDTRISSPGVRATYRLSESNQIEGFVQKFAPTVLPKIGSAYNPIPSQFYVDQAPGYDAVKNNLNFGSRYQGRLDSADMGYQLFIVNRNNPDGVYRWAAPKAGVAGTGTPIAGSAFSINSTGIYNSQEWFKYASLSKLDGIGGLNTSLTQFPVGAAFGLPNGVPAAYAGATLDTFFSGLGGQVPAGTPLTGWLDRQYKRETVIGFGVNKIFNGEPDSLTDQLIVRFEGSYTPNKTLTNPTLDQNFLKKNDLNTALILEKYQKFSADIPATYMVLQWMHRTATDIFGRSLTGYNNTPGAAPLGIKQANYVAFVAQQPSPTLEYRFDFTVLTDLKGGYMYQPGVKWKINRELQADVYANIFTGSDKKDSFTETLKYANEAFVRLTAFF